jgi:hypothetical protein
MTPDHELVRVSREMVEQLLDTDSEPVVLLRLERAEDGICELIVKTPPGAERPVGTPSSPGTAG